MKEVPGRGEPNPKPLHSGGIETHISDLQERGGFRRGVLKPDEPKQQPATPSHELSAHDRREQERHSRVLENPLRVQRPLSQNPGEQRSEAEPFQPNPAVQQAAERLGKPPPQSAEQEINAILPSSTAYIREMDSDDREGISYKLVPEKELPDEMGWDNFAELKLDLSSLLPKPESLIIYPDHATRTRMRVLSEHLTADEWESSTIKELELSGYTSRIPEFKEEMQEYRKAVKATVEVWRKRGLL